MNNNNQKYISTWTQLSKYLLALLVICILPISATAESTAEAGASPFYEKMFSYILFGLAGVVIIGAVASLFRLLNILVKVQQIRIYQEQGLEAYLEEVKTPKQAWWKTAYKRWTNVVPIEREKDILFDHSYDGIRELDNSLPPWWVAMFYITIAYAVIFIAVQHFSDYGISQAEEYDIEIAEAEEAVKAYLAKQANLVDESNVEALTDEGSIALGKQVYDINCAACHGLAGEGGVGPNLTDPYWLHGGSITDIFKTIKYGVPEKGMIAWKAQLRPAEMHKIASYIMTLNGTEPANAKEPQGELYQVENLPVPKDSLDQKLGMN